MLNLFKPPVQDSTTPLIDQVASPTTIDTSSYTPLEYYCRVSCDVVCPRVAINVKSIDLGSLQANAVREVDLGSLTNMCDDILTIVFENIPYWLLVNESVTTAGSSSSLHQEESKQAQDDDTCTAQVQVNSPLEQVIRSVDTENRTVPITLAAREKRTVRGTVMLALLSIVQTSSLSESPLDSPVGLPSATVDLDEFNGSRSVAIKHVISVRPTYVSADATSNRGKLEQDKDKDSYRQGNLIYIFCFD